MQKNIDITHRRGSLENFVDTLKKNQQNRTKETLQSDANKLKTQRKNEIRGLNSFLKNVGENVNKTVVKVEQRKTNELNYKYNFCKEIFFFSDIFIDY